MDLFITLSIFSPAAATTRLPIIVIPFRCDVEITRPFTPLSEKRVFVVPPMTVIGVSVLLASSTRDATSSALFGKARISALPPHFR